MTQYNDHMTFKHGRSKTKLGKILTLRKSIKIYNIGIISSKLNPFKFGQIPHIDVQLHVDLMSTFS